MSDTGQWLWRGEKWFVVQRPDGGIVANGEDGSFTAASASTWRSWKQSGYWLKYEPTASQAINKESSE